MPEGVDEKGKPEAVNLELAEPITTAARRRDSFHDDPLLAAEQRGRTDSASVPEAGNTAARPVAVGHSPMTYDTADKNKKLNKGAEGELEGSQKGTQGSPQGGQQQGGQPRQGQQGFGTGSMGGQQRSGQQGNVGQQGRGSEGGNLQGQGSQGNIRKGTVEEEEE